MGTSANIFKHLATEGQRFISSIRNEATKPAGKVMRTFGIEQAAELIGRSTTLIRTLEEDPNSELSRLYGETPREQNKRRAYSLERINQYRDFFGTRPTRPPGSECARVAVGNFKGGCGKSTTAIHLAVKAALDGYRVLLCDLDAQGTSSQMMGIIPGVDLSADDTIAPVLVDNPAGIDAVTRPTYIPGLSIVPANLALQDADLILPNPDLNNAEAMGLGASVRLATALDQVKDKYDLVVMDLGPNMGAVTVNALRAANGLIVPIPPAMNDYGSSVLFFATLTEFFEKSNHTLDFQHVLITKHTGSQEAVDAETLIRTSYTPWVLVPKMPITVELERQSNNFSIVYETRTPHGNAETFRNALTHMNAVNDAIMDSIRTVWDRQAGIGRKEAA